MGYDYDKKSFGNRLAHAWNIFRGKDDLLPAKESFDMGYSSSFRPDRPRLIAGNERSIIASIYTRISVDFSKATIRHVRTDKNGQYLETIDSPLNRCFTIEANKDQSARAFFRDVALTICDSGCAAIIPTDASFDPTKSESYTIKTLRVGKIIEWFPTMVRVELYNEKTGLREQLVVPKSITAIVENPFYPVMNEPNSTLKRLIRKLNILDAIDEQSGSGKLDVIIQVPYSARSEILQQKAEKRRKDLEDQLYGSKYGVAWMDATERITQLNRPAENNLMAQVESLTSTLYGQLGVTKEIFDGTADENMKTNYQNNTLVPLLSAVTEEMTRKFLSKTAITQGQTIMFFNDMFKMIPLSSIAEIADKLTRNEILTSNEIRTTIGYQPSGDPRADRLLNKNMKQEGGNAINNPYPSEASENIEESDALPQLDLSKLGL